MLTLHVHAVDCRRYLQLEPTHAEEFVAYLKQKERWGEAAKRLSGMLNDDTFRSIEGKSKHQLWLELCELITKHPAEVMAERIDVDAILRGGIRKYKDEVSMGSCVHGLWCENVHAKGAYASTRMRYDRAFITVAVAPAVA
jgi:pre-mRNA-splicing factor SYF1